MLDSFFEYQKITYQSLVNEKYRKGITHYRFHSEKYPYLVHVEHYVNNIYVVKYCMAKHKNNSKRYNLLIRDYKCSRIVSTCVRIMLSVLKKDPKASFGFMGAHTINLSKEFEENRENTKRFRIYKYAIEDLIGEEQFTHYMDKTNSTYFLSNNSVSQNSNLSENAYNMFLEIYPRLAGL